MRINQRRFQYEIQRKAFLNMYNICAWMYMYVLCICLLIYVLYVCIYVHCMHAYMFVFVHAYILCPCTSLFTWSLPYWSEKILVIENGRRIHVAADPPRRGINSILRERRVPYRRLRRCKNVHHLVVEIIGEAGKVLIQGWWHVQRPWSVTSLDGSTGVSLSKILGGNGFNNWWVHGRFSITRGTRPGCLQQSLRPWIGEW